MVRLRCTSSRRQRILLNDARPDLVAGIRTVAGGDAALAPDYLTDREHDVLTDSPAPTARSRKGLHIAEATVKVRASRILTNSTSTIARIPGTAMN